MNRLAVEAVNRVVGVAVRVRGSVSCLRANAALKTMDGRTFRQAGARTNGNSLLFNVTRMTNGSETEVAAAHSICPSSIDALIGIWLALHKGLDIQIDAAEARYLSSLVLEIEDDLLSRLLSAKLGIARVPNRGSIRGLARPGSEIWYFTEEKTRKARLVHGFTAGDGLLGVGTRLGTALLGLRAGQTVLWPNDDGRLVEVHLLRVTTISERVRRHA
ncbi:hypothetical protein OKW76_12260 [Sphingomonas sp. S1-29]|uniref:hypothetical protein n=1 Tax=Sphingomonas sp. S1-29 TaxID=2991074 RepID=UPI002240C02B|nr:hypothetical protein [Sphingomonas sp. S1-29]UZK68806.1 hypothetical protein OKW76_12260 [Sphingomonas sp. S1-29]